MLLNVYLGTQIGIMLLLYFFAVNFLWGKNVCFYMQSILVDKCFLKYNKRNQRLSRACIVHLVMKRTNWSYVKTMSCSGSHLEIPINIKNTKFVKDLPMIDQQFRFNQCNSFREEHISLFSPYGPVLILWPMVAAILNFGSARQTQIFRGPSNDYSWAVLVSIVHVA